MRRHPSGKGSRSPATGSASGKQEAPNPGAHAGAGPRDACATHHKVRSGDSLWMIAASVSAHTSDRATQEATRAIYEANRDTVGKNPDLIYPGQVLELPEDCQK